jgi:predicted AlkP superfamily pyrophosphatase or phosphodiesterase
MPRLGALLFTLLLVASSAVGGERKVLLIGIDGCRPDAITKADTPNLDRLAKNGVMSLNTSILGPRDCGNDTISGPGWSSIFTGVWADKHGVMDNDFKTPNYNRYPHFFSLLKQKRPSAVTASFVDWKPIADKIVSGANVSFCPQEALKGADAYEKADEEVAAHAAEFLKTKPVDAACVYFGQVDERGHASGFHPLVPSYTAAIEKVDRHIGALLDAIKARPNAANEEWLVIVTTDHGGQGTGHGGGHKIDEIRRVFLIVSGTGVDHAADRQTYLVDAVPTALAWLGAELDPKWELDGKPFGIASQASGQAASDR